jgi:putative CocE/NonD family hydrolase
MMDRRTFVAMSGAGLLAVCLIFNAFSEDPWKYANIKVERDQPARMRDGAVLYADVFRPDGPGTFPALLTRTPYDKQAELSPFTLAACRRGYVVVVQDVRGEFKSEGTFLPYLQEINDGHDTIEWVAGLPYVNGKVGTYGLSYPGAAQWMTAPTRPPHLVAMVPAMTFVDARHFIYDGGIFVKPILNWLLGRQVRERRQRQLPLISLDEVQKAWSDKSEEWMTYMPLRDLPVMSGFRYWKDWLDHPDDDAYWAPFDIQAQYGKVEVPAMNLSGWNDDHYGQPGAIRNFVGMRKDGATEEARRGQRLLIGPWSHGVPSVGRTSFYGVDYGPSAAIDYSDTLLQFFDYWLKGIDEGYSSQAPVRIFIMGDNVWRAENEWPPARTEYRAMFLRSEAQLIPEGPGKDSPEQFVYDPHNPLRVPRRNEGDWRTVTSRRDVLVYTSAPLQTDIEITGQILAKLWVSSTAPDTDFSMRLLDVAPDGRPSNFTSALGILRARYRSTENELPPEPLPRGEATELTIGLGYTSIVIKAGHRLQVFVGGSVFPYIHLNVWEPFVSMSQAVVATQTVYHDAAHPSRVILPVIPR